MARPKKKELPKRESFITLRLTSELYDVLTTDARAAHLSRSEYIRQLITDHHPVVHQEIVYNNLELLERIRDLGKIGSNLNQIARYLNGGGRFTEGLAEEVSGCIAQLLQMRNDIKEMAGEYRGDC